MGQFGPAFVLLICLLPLEARAANVPSNFTIEGRLYDNSTGQPYNDFVDIKLEIVEQGKTCVFYRETHENVDLTSSETDLQGRFSLMLGAGTSSSGQILTAFGVNPSFKDSDDNNVSDSNGDCASAPTAGSNRAVRIWVKKTTDTTFNKLSPDTILTSTPTSIVAEYLQGKSPSDFVQIKDDASTDLTQANLENVFSSTNYPKLQDLLANTFSSDFSLNNQRLTNVAAPTAATDAVNRNWVDTHLGDKAADLSGVNAGTNDGHTIIWDAANNRWTTGAVSATDNTKLPLTGGVMQGPVTFNGHDIYNTGHITMGNQTLLMLGRFSNAQETALALGAADKGRILFNTDQNKIRVWDGFGFVDVGSGVTDLTAGTGINLTGSGNITVSVDVGTGANQIPQLNANGQLGIGTSAVTNGAVLDLWGTTQNTSSLIVPRADTANRPTSPVDGMIRYNTSLAKFEVFEDGSWRDMISSASGDDLGNHMATSNIRLNGQWLSGDGDNEGLYVDNSGNIGAGINTPQRPLHVDGVMRLEPTTLPAGNAGDLAIDSANGNTLNFHNGTSWQTVGTGNGTVTSVELLVPSIMSVTGSPVTSSGTISLGLQDQSANLVFAGPTSGGPGQPSFRTLVASDIPSLDAAKIGSGTLPIARGGTGRTTYDNNALLTTDGSGNITAGVTCTTPGYVMQWNGSDWECAPAASGTVTSVDLSVPSIMSVSGSPVTSSGTISLGLQNQSANLVFAGPTSGGPGQPSFRTLVASDIPNLDAAKIASGTLPIARGGTGRATYNNNAILTTDGSGNIGAGVTCTTPGYVMQWNGSSWACASVSGSGDNLGNHTATQHLAMNGKFVSYDGSPKGLYIDSGGFVGVNTTNAEAELTVYGSDHNVSIKVINANSSSQSWYPQISGINYMGSKAPDGSPQLTVYNSRGTFSSPASLASGDELGIFAFQGQKESGVPMETGWGNGALIRAVTTGNWSPSSSPAKMIFMTTASGSITPSERMTIQSDGKIGIGTSVASETLDVRGSALFSDRVYASHVGGKEFTNYTSGSSAGNFQKYSGSAMQSASVAGSDVAYRITFNVSGTLTVPAGTTSSLVKVFFRTPFALTPICTFSPANDVAAKQDAKLYIMTATNYADLIMTEGSLASGVYIYNVICMDNRN